MNTPISPSSVSRSPYTPRADGVCASSTDAGEPATGDGKPSKRSFRFRPLLDDGLRKDLKSAAMLASFATVPIGGMMVVAMADDAGSFSPRMRRVQKALVPYAMSTTFGVGLIASPLVLGAAYGAALLGNTVGRLPVPSFSCSHPSPTND